MAGTIADSGTAVADITATSACRTESDSEYSGTVTAKATFTCGTTGTAVSDGTSDKAADIQTKEEITLRGNRYSVDRLIGNGGEAEVYVARTLLEAIAHINGVKSLPQALPDSSEIKPIAYPDLADVRGQLQARRALEIAACGQHHLLLIGSPGCGKSLLASRLPDLLPDASEEEGLESAAIASCSGRGIDLSLWRLRALRASMATRP